MISSKELVKGPFSREPSRIATDSQIREQIDDRAQFAITSLNRRKKFFFVEIGYPDQPLFTIDGDNKTANFDLKGVNYQTHELDHLQEEALDHMKKNYGFDLENIRKTEKKDDGTTGAEVTYYPSTTVQGLEFKREKLYYTQSNAPYKVYWYVGAQGDLADPKTGGYF
jgi:hypothetical protein